MQTYCERDVDLNYILYEKICSKKYSEESLRLEHEFQKCILQQEENGFMFDIPAAEKLTQQLQARRSKLNDELQKIFPPYEKDDGVLYQNGIMLLEDIKQAFLSIERKQLFLILIVTTILLMFCF